MKRLIYAPIRLLYRIAYGGMRIKWFLQRPATASAAVALWHQDRVLLVRSSYRRCLLLPGGGIHAGESSQAAARRELKEEVDLVIPDVSLHRAWTGALRYEHRQDHIDIWEAELSSPLPVRINHREIVWADWLSREEALERDLLPHVREYLEGRWTAEHAL
jgi:8-oxo-dGTP pyrophosphatase MutT (NUDIX family)